MISDGRSSTVRGRGDRRVLAPLASAALATALLAGCGGTATDSPDEATEIETTEETDGDASDSEEADDGENLFEGTWGFGHDTKVLDAEELSQLLEEEAESRGPEEMSLSVECGDGVDTEAGDDTAECIAYADEGVEHVWAITVGPADSGLEIEVANVG